MNPARCRYGFTLACGKTYTYSDPLPEALRSGIEHDTQEKSP
ncbi:hypothetical protein THL1_2595 [Pseudomonas sp. TCU-HL1]|nr:hypothetical protein THL1_2595 [Pseudomonas sp. TCU-HL1]